MKNKTVFVSSLAFAFFICIIFNSCNKGPTDVTGDIKEANNGFMTAFNSGDLEALASNYIDSACLFPPNLDIIKGTAAIKGFWGGVMSMGVKKARLETVTAQCCGDFTIEQGSYMLYTADNAMIDHGKYIVVWKKLDNTWKIAKDIWNTSNPPAPVAPALAADTTETSAADDATWSK